MKFALIPPVAYLTDSRQTGLQLMLPHMMRDNTVYRRYYSELCADPDQYVIMDNGAAEGEVPSNAELVEIAQKYLPDEFALPDVLGDGELTMRQAARFLLAHNGDMFRAGVKLGFVAQGKTIRETVSVIWDAWEEFGREISVIYIPRRLTYDDGWDARMRVLRADLPEHYEYHLFGGTKLWADEVKWLIQAKDTLTEVRSMDTSMPYNYGWRYRLLEVDSFEQIDRVDNYFDLSMNDAQREITLKNISTMLGWIK